MLDELGVAHPLALSCIAIVLGDLLSEPRVELLWGSFRWGGWLNRNARSFAALAGLLASLDELCLALRRLEECLGVAWEVCHLAEVDVVRAHLVATLGGLLANVFSPLLVAF